MTTNLPKILWICTRDFNMIEKNTDKKGGKYLYGKVMNYTFGLE